MQDRKIEAVLCAPIGSDPPLGVLYLQGRHRSGAFGKGDILELADSFCKRACDQHRLPRLGLSPAALRALEAAEWPGNVRQLENAIVAGAGRAAGLGAQRIERQHLFPQERASEAPGQETETLQEATRRFQEDLLGRTLEETEWNGSETARRLDVARSRVYRLISTFGISRL